MLRIRFWLLLLSSMALALPALAQDPPEKASRDDIARLIKDLDSAEFPVREKATEKLVEVGAPAIPPLVNAVQGESLEVTARGVDVLRKLLDKPETKDAARKALEEVAKSPNKSAARRADAILNPDKTPQTPPVPAQNVPVPLRQAIPLGGRIQIQGIAGGGNVRISVKNANGNKTIDVDDNGKKIQIAEDAGGAIKMLVTETEGGKEKTSKYEAKNADELKKNHPDAHKLYEKYKDGVVGNIQIRAFGVAPVLPVPGVPGLASSAKALEKIEKAKAELAKAALALKKLDLDKASPDDVKKLAEQIEAATKQLEEAEKALGK
ncbi:MAG: hypothetical protein HYS13_14775 [Planctomycetia bacterium]|nr:hypothetical protein [Planctomycetia bacterium]